MVYILKGKSTDSSKLERFIGAEQAEKISKGMEDWYGPPVAVGGVPGNVWVHKGGDFMGPIRDGYEATAMDMVWDFKKRMLTGIKAATRANQTQFNAGFASLSDLISKASAGLRQDLAFSKTGAAALAVGGSTSLWIVGAQPAAGALPTSNVGSMPTSANTGAQFFNNPTSGNTTHFVAAFPSASAAGTLLLYDRIFHSLKTASASTTEAVTGTQTRYANVTVATAADYAAGNFLFIEQGTTLASVGHNWTVCTYTNQAGATAKTLPSVTGLGTGTAGRLDMPVNTWFCPLATGDTGVAQLTQMQCSSASITGSAIFVIGHPIAWMPCPLVNITCQIDGINSAFNLTRILDNACLAMLEVAKPATAATTYSGTFTICQSG